MELFIKTIRDSVLLCKVFWLLPCTGMGASPYSHAYEKSEMVCPSAGADIRKARTFFFQSVVGGEEISLIWFARGQLFCTDCTIHTITMVHEGQSTSVYRASALCALMYEPLQKTSLQQPGQRSIKIALKMWGNELAEPCT